MVRMSIKDTLRLLGILGVALLLIHILSYPSASQSKSQLDNCEAISCVHIPFITSYYPPPLEIGEVTQQPHFQPNYSYFLGQFNANSLSTVYSVTFDISTYNKLSGALISSEIYTPLLPATLPEQGNWFTGFIEYNDIGTPYVFDVKIKSFSMASDVVFTDITPLVTFSPPLTVNSISHTGYIFNAGQTTIAEPIIVLQGYLYSIYYKSLALHGSIKPGETISFVIYDDWTYGGGYHAPQFLGAQAIISP